MLVVLYDVLCQFSYELSPLPDAEEQEGKDDGSQQTTPTPKQTNCLNGYMSTFLHTYVLTPLHSDTPTYACS